MININGTEYGLFWSVGAHLEYDAWVLAHQGATYSDAIVEQACIMSKAYDEAHGIERGGFTRSDIKNLPARFLDELIDAANAQVKADTEVTVETKPGKKAAAGS